MMPDLRTIARHLSRGVAEWRNESDPDGPEVYAGTAAALAETLRGVSDPDPEGDRFAVADGLYTFAARYYAGQTDYLYRVLGVLGDSPIRFSPGCGREMEPAPRAVFDLLRGIRKGDGKGAATDFAERAAVVLAISCAEADDAAAPNARDGARWGDDA